MSRIKSLKDFQQQAVDSALNLFAANRDLLDIDRLQSASREATVGQNGYLLIEAPTGSGKTLIAGQVVEKFSAQEQVVWFWFAPFKGVISQTESFLREQYLGLRLLSLKADRSASGFRAGDVFVTTWGSVAVSQKEGRIARKEGELSPSIDRMVQELKDQGFRIGVVVDEAHHGFRKGTQSFDFFKSVLDPDYTLLITATPDDKDVEIFRKQVEIERLNRITISRHDAVNSGLIKDGIKCIAYLADPDKQNLVDFEQTALRDACKLHQKLKEQLGTEGINLVPLMLVQVDSAKNSVDTAKQKLMKLGFREDQIAIHTAKEPDPHLLALANDEKKEVLIFKMAVALGFDAPRAFTLVSMRASHDVDFGVQIVGRILRVHRRLQGRSTSALLNYGYVFLADSDVQKGIAQAGERINRLETAYAAISPLAAVVRIGNSDTVQLLDSNGQSHLFHAPTPPSISIENGDSSAGLPNIGQAGQPVELPYALEILTGKISVKYPQKQDIGGLSFDSDSKESPSIESGYYQYLLKEGIPKFFKREVLPKHFDGIEAECADRFLLSAENMLQAIANNVKVKKVTLDVFTQNQLLELTDATLSSKEVALLAQSILLKSGVFNPRTLKPLLLKSVRKSFDRQGLKDQVASNEALEVILNQLLVKNPTLLSDAQKTALANHTIVEQADPIPKLIKSISPLTPSLKNVYGCIPDGLNRWETAFAQLLDSDLEDVVQWWHRNERQKPWSCSLVLPDGRNFYPDFIISADGRKSEDNLLLLDTKEAVNRDSEIIKSGVAHKSYGNVMIITQLGDRENYEWYTVRYDSRTRSAVKDRVFHTQLMKIH